jgi:hypothetical protein
MVDSGGGDTVKGDKVGGDKVFGNKYQAETMIIQGADKAALEALLKEQLAQNPALAQQIQELLRRLEPEVAYQHYTTAKDLCSPPDLSTEYSHLQLLQQLFPERDDIREIAIWFEQIVLQ